MFSFKTAHFLMHFEVGGADSLGVSRGRSSNSITYDEEVAIIFSPPLPLSKREKISRHLGGGMLKGAIEVAANNSN